VPGGGGGVLATPPKTPVAPPTAAPWAAPGPPPAAAPIAAPEAAPRRPPAKPRWRGSYGLVQAERPNAKVAITHGAIRFVPTFPRSSIECNRRADAGSSHPFSQPARKPLAEPVRDDLVETVKTSSVPEMARQRASEWLRTPRISHDVGIYSGVGRCRGVEAYSVERKLAAIFAADVAGYSGLMGRDEVGTLRTLTAYRVIIDRLIASIAVGFSIRLVTVSSPISRAPWMPRNVPSRFRRP
jgi:hypothetical protein